MSFLRNGERRKYVGGKSESYVYPTSQGIRIFCPGQMSEDDFWEIVCRCVERVDGEKEAERFAQRVVEYRSDRFDS